METILKDHRYLIFGGTGSLGRKIVDRLLEFNPPKIKVFSRDEQKQCEMRRHLSDKPNIEYYIGDIRDQERVKEALAGIDIAINVAALKHVSICEEYPVEAVQTNILGSINIRREALNRKIKKVISISTDKAVKPINVLGLTKALQERINLLKLEPNSFTKFISVRCGNVFGSRGSVLDVFYECIINNKPLPITDLEMTRFILTLDQAVDTVFSAIKFGNHGEVWIRRCPSAKVIDVGKELAKGIKKVDDYPINNIGIRSGEKIHEILISSEELNRVEIKEDNFVLSTNPIADSKLELSEEYSSLEAPRLSFTEITALLKSEGWL
jgi:UDP-glucose 4-epimerase